MKGRERMRHVEAWRPDEDAFLISTHSGLSTHQQAEKLARSHAGVTSRRVALMRAGRLDPCQRKTCRRWSAEEDQRLLELLGEGLPLTRIASILHRTYTAISERCQKIGGVPWLRRPENGHQVRTASEVGALFGVDYRRVCHWIEGGWLKARRNRKMLHSHWLITDSALMDFVSDRRSWFAWKAERITDPDWREMAVWERRRARGRWLTTGQAAQHIGSNKWFILRQIVAGKLPAVRHGQQRYYVWSGDLEALR